MAAMRSCSMESGFGNTMLKIMLLPILKQRDRALSLEVSSRIRTYPGVMCLKTGLCCNAEY